jgi:hypothetical protein
LASGWLAAHNGDLATAQLALAKAKPLAQAGGDASAISMATIVEAELALSAHQPKQAIELLTAKNDGSELYFSHAVLMRAETQAGDLAAALAQANWLASERGRAYAEWNGHDMWSGVNIVESNLALLSAAELETRLGQPKLARRKLDAFLAAWPNAGNLPWLRERVALVSH